MNWKRFFQQSHKIVRPTDRFQIPKNFTFIKAKSQNRHRQRVATSVSQLSVQTVLSFRSEELWIFLDFETDQ